MELEVEIDKHAVDRYCKRVLGVNPEIVADGLREHAEEVITEATREPVAIYRGKKNAPPIHIKGDVAVPVDVKEPSDPARTGEVAVIPTVYPSSTFVGKINDQTGN